MSATLDLRLADIYAKLGTFIQTVIGVDPSTSQTVAVVQGQANRVSMPDSPFILMQGMVTGRLGTNIDTWDTVNQTQATEQKTKVKMQLDCYGPDSNAWATILSTLLRDQLGCAALKPTCQPLFTDPPFQGALIDGEEQYEERWTVMAYVQYNPVTTFAQQSATAVQVSVINVDERYK
jgi:hypothetical protein